MRTSARKEHRVMRFMKKVYLAWRALDHPELKQCSEQKSTAVENHPLLVETTFDVNRDWSESKCAPKSKSFIISLSRQCKSFFGTSEHEIVETAHQHVPLPYKQYINLTTPFEDHDSAQPLQQGPQTNTHDLFFASSPGLKHAGGRHLTHTDAVTIKTASLSMSLRRFLAWINQAYSVETLIPHVPSVDSKLRCKPVPFDDQDLHSQLVTLMALYDPKGYLIENKAVFDIMVTIYSQLNWYYMMLEYRIKEIGEHHTDLSIRDFVMWCYDSFKLPETEKRLSRPIPWNPRAIHSKSRVSKEAITYYEHMAFVENDEELSICAKHIVYCLRGGRDWRERQGERLVSQHPTPAQVAGVRAVLSKGYLLE